MKSASKHVSRLLFATAFLFANEGRAESAEHDHDHGHGHAHVHTDARTPLHLHSLDVTVRPRRDGMLEVEEKFCLEVDGVSIKRGPMLNYMTVFASEGGLVLDTAMEIVEITRNGKPEMARLSTSHGTTSLLVGKKDVLLEPGPHDYVVRYRRLGSWLRKGGQLTDSLDVAEAFRRYSIDRLTASIVLPEGAGFNRRSAAVTGTTAEGPGYKTTTGDGILTVETTAPLAPNHSVFLNTAWSGDGFSSRRKWMQLFLQHPRIPMAAIGCGVMVLALWALIAGGTRRARERRLAAATG